MNSLPVLRKDYRAWLSISVILFFVVTSLGARWLSPFDPLWQDSTRMTQGPSALHWMGTDSLGRDLLSRLMDGGQVSMAVAFITAIAALFLGCLYGGIAGMSSGALDAFLMRTLDILYTIPTLLLLILLNVAFGEGLPGIIFALSLEGMMTVARLVRSQVKQLKEMDFVMAQRALGSSSFSILVKHIFPNAAGPILVTLTALIPSNIMYEAFLSFIGLGVPAPLSSWGTLSNEGWRGMLSYPHLILFPGIAIFVSMLAFQFLGDSLRDAFDVKGVSKDDT
jgi:oligopeptide transport system permease protein